MGSASTRYAPALTAPGAPPILPTITLTIFACSNSFFPHPTPTSSMTNPFPGTPIRSTSTRPALLSHSNARTSAAPVGVMISPLAVFGAGAVAMPASSRSVAGAGTGRMPWSVKTVPLVKGRGEQVKEETLRWYRAAMVPMTSTIESIAPTSWKWTVSSSAPWVLDSAWAR